MTFIYLMDFQSPYVILSALDFLKTFRQLVETIISQLTDRFAIADIKAKKLCHFLRRITRKILAHTVAIAVNKMINSEECLQFENLVTC